MGAITCCFDGAVWLFKAIIKVLYHSSEQQNEFQSRNYCPIIFRIIKASSASIQTITSPSCALPQPLPLPPCQHFLSHQFVHLILWNRTLPEDAGLFLRGWGVGRTRMDIVAPVLFVVRLQCLFFLLYVHFETSLLWKISIGTLGQKVRV